MNTPVPYYRARLSEEFSRRVSKNPQYSLRAFARAIGIQPSALSQILSGTRYFTDKIAERIFRVLELSLEEQEHFLGSVVEARKQAGLKRYSPKMKTALSQVRASEAPPGTTSEHGKRELTSDLFRVISDWYHFAILELTTVPAFKPDARRIAALLGITPAQARTAWQRLLDLEMVENVDGNWRKTDIKYGTLDVTKTTPWHRLRQKQILSKSLESIENDPIEVRNHSSITFAVAPSRIVEAKKRINEFLWEMSELLNTEERKQVYEMSIQLFPLQKSGAGK